jgi:hypothetical protein
MIPDTPVMKRLVQEASLDEVVERPRKKVKTEMPSVSVLSPLAQKMLDFFTPMTKIRMTKNFKKDNKLLRKKDELEEDYQNDIRIQELAKNIEREICAKGQCPNCQSALHLFHNPNFPAVDLKCENCHKLFQVKVTLGSSYLSRRKKFITIGSTKCGTECHTTSDLTLVPGYICLKLKSKKSDTVGIDYLNSFVLLPRYKNPYSYKTELSHFGKPMITWDNSVLELGLGAVFPSKPNQITYKEYECIPKENLYQKFFSQHDK